MQDAAGAIFTVDLAMLPGGARNLESSTEKRKEKMWPASF